MLHKLGLAVALALTLSPLPALAVTPGEVLKTHLYEGSFKVGHEALEGQCADDNREACFASGTLGLASALEQLARELYRYGAVTPNMLPLNYFGMNVRGSAEPANPKPEPITYEAFRTVLETFVSQLDTARAELEQGGVAGDYVILLDPMLIKIDLNGDGKIGPGETVSAFWPALSGMGNMMVEPPGKTKPGSGATPDTSIGLDRADALWLAGYAQFAAAQTELILSHDFSAFFDAYMHRVFPKSNLPLAQFSADDDDEFLGESNGDIADMIAGIHSMNFPVLDAERLANVRMRLLAVTALSRQNWEAILAETDDNREMVPSPSQTSVIPGMDVTTETVAAWHNALDTVDAVLEGELLLPHWRFPAAGFDLKAYFETAKRTDVIMLLTGLDAMPFLKKGKVVDADSFADLTAVLGDDWPLYALWFN